jgi:adenosine 3'-phospho 5'-phosphosulfate transporter B2
MSIYNQSLYVTLVSATFSAGGLLTSRQLGPAVGFVLRHPEALWQIASLSAAATAGELSLVHVFSIYLGMTQDGDPSPHPDTDYIRP